MNSNSLKEQDKRKSANKNGEALAFGATAAGAAALGAGGMVLGENLVENSDDDVIVASVEEPLAPEAVAPVEEPQDIQENQDVVADNIAGEEGEEIVQDNPGNQDPEPAVEAEVIAEEPLPIEDPDGAVEAILAEDQIDSEDIEMADVINFDEVGEVYTPDGNKYNAATFHDPDGNELMLVDIDNDLTFDIITDTDGLPVIDSDGNFIAAGNLTVDDAQESIVSDGYLACEDGENIADYGSDSLDMDIIS